MPELMKTNQAMSELMKTNQEMPELMKTNQEMPELMTANQAMRLCLNTTTTYRVGLALAAENLRDSKVTYLKNFPFLIHQDILRLEISMEDLFRVDVLQREQHLCQVLEYLLKVRPTSGPST